MILHFLRGAQPQHIQLFRCNLPDSSAEADTVHFAVVVATIAAVEVDWVVRWAEQHYSGPIVAVHWEIRTSVAPCWNTATATKVATRVLCVALRCVAGGRAGWLAGCDAMRRMRCDAMRRDALEMHAQVGSR